MCHLELYIIIKQMVSHLETPGFNDPEIGGHPVAKFDVNDVSKGELGGLHRDLLTVPANHGVLRHKVLEALHDLGRLCLLIVKKGMIHNAMVKIRETKMRMVK